MISTLEYKSSTSLAYQYYSLSATATSSAPLYTFFQPCIPGSLSHFVTWDAKPLEVTLSLTNFLPARRGYLQGGDRFRHLQTLWAFYNVIQFSWLFHEI